MKNRVQCSNFIPVDAKKIIQKIGLEYDMLYNIIEIKRTIISELDRSYKKTIKKTEAEKYSKDKNNTNIITEAENE